MAQGRKADLFTGGPQFSDGHTRRLETDSLAAGDQQLSRLLPGRGLAVGHHAGGLGERVPRGLPRFPVRRRAGGGPTDYHPWPSPRRLDGYLRRVVRGLHQRTALGDNARPQGRSLRGGRCGFGAAVALRSVGLASWFAGTGSKMGLAVVSHALPVVHGGGPGRLPLREATGSRVSPFIREEFGRPRLRLRCRRLLPLYYWEASPERPCWLEPRQSPGSWVGP